MEVLPAQAMVVTGCHVWALPPGGNDTSVFSDMFKHLSYAGYQYVLHKKRIHGQGGFGKSGFNKA